MYGYFGPTKFRKEHETQMPTPIGRSCVYCEEPIKGEDVGTIINNDVLHYECGLRSVAGSVGHQKGHCSCHGGNEEDPPGMTKRQAAIAAANYWHMHGQDY
jgi:hypothetical protein